MPPPLSTHVLALRLLGRNCGFFALGMLALSWAAFFWLLTVMLPASLVLWIRRPDIAHACLQSLGDAMRILLERHSWSGFANAAPQQEFVLSLIAQCAPPTAWFLLAVAAGLLVFARFGHCRLFYAYRQEDPLIPLLVTEWRLDWAPGIFLPVALLCLAPHLTWLALHYFRSVCWPLPGELPRAVRAYRVLAASRGWQPYPPFLSQRRVLRLLALAGLIRISKRFGQLEVKAVGHRPITKKRH